MCCPTVTQIIAKLPLVGVVMGQGIAILGLVVVIPISDSV